MAQTTIVERQTLSFVYSNDYGAWISNSNPSLFVPEGGTAYVVAWGDSTHNCTAFTSDAAPDCVLLGNPLPLGGEDNGIPFLMSSRADGSGMTIMTYDEGETREVAVYRQEEAAVPSASVKIKGYSGREFEYQNVPKVWLAAPESTVDNPVLVPFTYGEALENVEVVPDFSAGDQTVTLPDGYLARSAVVKKPSALVPENIRKGETVAGIEGAFEGGVPEEKIVEADFSDGAMMVEPSEGKILTKVTIPKPADLIPENIAEGVDIAGIIGSLKSGGGGVVFAKGYAKGTDGALTINHNLGVVPKVIVVQNSATTMGVSNNIIESVVAGIMNVFGSSTGTQIITVYKSPNNVITRTVIPVSQHPTNSNAIAGIYAATNTSFKFGNSTYQTKSTNTYYWMAFAGF